MFMDLRLQVFVHVISYVFFYKLNTLFNRKHVFVWPLGFLSTKIMIIPCETKLTYCYTWSHGQTLVCFIILLHATREWKFILSKMYFLYDSLKETQIWWLDWILNESWVYYMHVTHTLLAILSIFFYLDVTNTC